MYMSIILHKTKAVEAKEALKYLYDRLNELFPGKVRAYHDGLTISVDGQVHIDMRCGSDGNKYGGIHPDYYYTDAPEDSYVAIMLEQGASKYNGMRVHTIDQLIQIIEWYMDLYEQIAVTLGYLEREAE